LSFVAFAGHPSFFRDPTVGTANTPCNAEASGWLGGEKRLIMLLLPPSTDLDDDYADFSLARDGCCSNRPSAK
jgi:hypothetical protein